VRLLFWPWKSRRLPLAAGILGAMLVLHAAIVPLLYVGLDRIIVRTHSELFVAVAHGYLAARVREFDSQRFARSTEDLEAFVDEIQSSGLVEYTEVQWNGQVLRRLADPLHPPPERTEHDRFGEGNDRIYHVVAKLDSGGQPGTLRLGFGEAPITAHIAEARRLMVYALAAYAVAVVGAALFLARWLWRPLNLLQQRSMRVAAGDLHEELRVASGIREFDQLGASLEQMRAELVDAGAQLHRKQRLETVGTLAGGVAHEFNNILVPLTLFTESALKVIPAEHVANPWLTRAVAAARRAREVVSKLLLFSGRGPPANLTPMQIAPAVEEALRLFGSLRPSNIELDVRIDPATDLVAATSGLVVQIVMNLCTNAYQAIPPSGGRITVALGNVQQDGGKFVQLTVADTGVGMDPQTASRALEPFFTTREIGGGSGLGLAVVHGLVKSMSGGISVASELGHGTEFKILFPSVGTGT
jgi:signal transduction histidine kinase